jgi:hypothetical protein
MFSTSQKNTLLNLIKESGIDAREFTLTASVEPLELKLTYKPEKFYFRVVYVKIGTDQSRQDVMRLATFSTPKPGLIFDLRNEYQHSNLDKWDTVIAVASQWLKLLKTEFKQPDLWAEMEDTPHLFADEEVTTDEHFTPAEIKLLEERVAEVEQRVLALKLPAEAAAAVVETVREVPAKAKRFTKKELADCIVGSLVKEGFKWGLTTEHMSAAWDACQHFFTFLLPG